MYRRRDAVATADEVSRREDIHGHDRRAAEEAAKLGHLAHFAAGTGMMRTAVVLLFVTPISSTRK